jgi:hypothetical protein
MKPPTGTTIKLAATCDINTDTVNIPVRLVSRGIKQSIESVKAQRILPVIYHLWRLRVISVMGASIKRQIFEDTPNAVIEAAVATENPFCVNMNGKETVINPWLIPDGRTRNRNVNGLAIFLLYAILRYSLILPVQPSGCTESSTIWH